MIDLSATIGPITATDTGNGNTLSVVSNTVGDKLSTTATTVASTSYPGSTVTFSGFQTPTTSVPSGLYAYIVSTLGGVIPSSPVTIPVGQLDGFLDIPSVTLDFSKAKSQGTVAISASSASLFPGTTHSATIGSVTGTYVSSTQTFNLTLNNVNLNAGGLLTASFSSLSITDNENGSPNQTLVSVQSATVTLPPLDNTALNIQGTQNVPGLTITKQGFTLATLTANLPSVTFQNALELTAPSFQFSNVSYTTAGDSLTGMVTISAATVALFPNRSGQSTFSSTVTGFSGTFNLATGAVSLGAASATLGFGGVAQLSAQTVVFTLDPAAHTFTMTTGYSTVVIGQFVYLSGNFAIQSGQDFGVSFAGGTPAPESVTAVELGGSNINAFFGVGGPYWQQNGTTNPTGAYGLAFSNLSFGLALLTPTSASDTTGYYALQASVYQVQSVLPGQIPVSVKLGQQGNPVTLAVNGAFDTANQSRAPPSVDFSQLAGGGLTVPTGTATVPVVISLSQALFQVSGPLAVSLGSFAQFSGNFAIQKSSLTGVPLTGNGSVNASVLTLGASAVTGFLGENAGTPQAYGLSVDVNSLALAIVLGQPSGDTTEQSWVALSASVDNVTITGIPALTSVTGSAIQVDVNSTAADGTAVEFSQLPGGSLSVLTGPNSSVPLTYSGALGLAASGNLSLALTTPGGSATIAGMFAFSQTSVILGTSRTTTSVIQVSATAASTTLVVGANGPTVSAIAINGAFLISSAGVAGQVQVGTLTITGLPSPISLPPGAITNAFFELNTTGAAASATQNSAALFDFSTPDQFNFVAFGGTITGLGLDNILSISGSFAVSDSTVSPTVGSATLNNASLLTIGLNQFQAAAVAGGFGVSVSGGSLGLALLEPPAPPSGTDTRYWLAVVGSGLAGSLSLGGNVSASVQNGAVAINQASGTDASGNAATPLDWATAFSTPVTPIAGLTVQLAVGKLMVSGSLASLNVFNVLGGSANFGLSETTAAISFNGMAPANVTGATLFTLALSNLQASAGSGGFGISLSGGDLGLAVLEAPKPQNGTDSRSWVAVTGSGLNGSLSLGSSLSAAASGVAVAINSASGSASNGGVASALDWTKDVSLDGGMTFAATIDPGANISPAGSVSLPITAMRSELLLSGSLTGLNIFNVITASANFAFSEATAAISFTGMAPANVTGATLLTLALSNVQASAGAGGFSISLGGGDLGIAVLEAPAPPSGTTDTRSWIAVTGSGLAGSLTLGGLVSASASGVAVAINSASGALNGVDASPIDWTQDVSLDGGTTFGATIDPGANLTPSPTPSLAITAKMGGFSLSGLLASLNIFNVISGSANFALSEQTAAISFTGAAPASVTGATLLTLAVSNLKASAGGGGFGVSISGGDLGLAVLEAPRRRMAVTQGTGWRSPGAIWVVASR